MKVRNRRRLTINPFVSESQRRACYAADDPDWDCSAWEKVTPKGKLPERKKKPTTNSARRKLKLKLARKKGKLSGRSGPTPNQLDPQGLGTLRRQMSQVLAKQFARLAGDIVKLVSVDDAFGLANRKAEEVAVVSQNVSLDPVQNLSLADRIEAAAQQTDTEPTPAQVEAGNYRKGRVTFHGIPVVIENPAGSTRTKYEDDGSVRWSREMKAHYGYVSRTLSPHDGDHVDVYLGPEPESDRVFVIDQQKPLYMYGNSDEPVAWTLDEHKCMLGWPDRESAVAAYLSHYPRGWKLGPVTEMSVAEFREWLEREAPRPTTNAQDQLLDLPDIRQRDSFSCGAAAAMSVGRYFGVGPETLDEWKQDLGTTEEGSTSPQAIVEYMLGLGLSVTPRRNMSVDDLKNCWEVGLPILCPIQEYGVPSKQASMKYGHWVVVIGVALDHVFVQDPSFDNVAEEGKHPDTQGLPEELINLAMEFLGVPI